MTTNDMDIDTYHDALAFTADRLDSEIAAIVAFMREHWRISSDDNRQIMMREFRALSRARRERAGQATASACAPVA